MSSNTGARLRPRPCIGNGSDHPCPTRALTTHKSSRCDQCRMVDYGYNHQQIREQWRSQVEAGIVRCARCGKPINPEDAWDLGHCESNRRQYNGPEHADCNRATFGPPRASNVF